MKTIQSNNINLKEFIKARDIFNDLGINKTKTKFTDWIEQKIKKFNLNQGEDYVLIYEENNVFSQEEIINKSPSPQKGGRPKKEYYINKNIIINLCMSCRNQEKVKEVIEKYNLNNSEKIIYKCNKRKELSFLDKLEESLKPFDLKGKRQYPVFNKNTNGYKRIDYYIPQLKIAIEYDENGHANYTYKQQELRQKEIEKELGCKFIRVTDKNSDEYNLGYIIKKIFSI